jgi:hypothetical protein
MYLSTDKLFCGDGGDLYTVENGRIGHVLRPKYAYTFRDIENSLQLRSTIRSGPYAWPGGYEMFLVTSDGGVLCFDCAKKEYRQLAYSMRHKLHDGWLVDGCWVYEEGEEWCCHCNKAFHSEEDEHGSE